MGAVAADTTAHAPRRQIVNVVAFALVLTVNGLANALPINGVTSGEVSDMFPSLVTPAGYVFSIWGLIYALLAVFVGYQVLPAQRDNPRLERLGYAFAVSCVCNATWLFAWHYQQIALAEVLLVALLVALVVCYERLHAGVASRAERLAVLLPFSIYLGWVTVATVANTAILLLDQGIDGGDAAGPWGVVAIAAATGIGLAMLVRRSDIAFDLVLVWAFVGIAVEQSPRSTLVAAVAIGACALLVAAIAWWALSARMSRRRSV